MSRFAILTEASSVLTKKFSTLEKKDFATLN